MSFDAAGNLVQVVNIDGVSTTLSRVGQAVPDFDCYVNVCLFSSMLRPATILEIESKKSPSISPGTA